MRSTGATRPRDPYYDRCPETYNGFHGLSDIRGRCPYCRRQYEPPARMPEHLPVSELSDACGQFYDPDWGVTP